MKIADLAPSLHAEILSRSVNEIWKQPSGNKMWVTFFDLKDDMSKSHCAEDTSGPQAFKYCNDGGVYYVYSFVEHDWLGGWVDWPWGAQSLAIKFDIDLKVIRILKLGRVNSFL